MAQRETRTVILTNFIEVEREVACDGAVEPGFEERRPPLLERVRASTVVPTDTGYTGKDRLEK